MYDDFYYAEKTLMKTSSNQETPRSYTIRKENIALYKQQIESIYQNRQEWIQKNKNRAQIQSYFDDQ